NSRPGPPLGGPGRIHISARASLALLARQRAVPHFSGRAALLQRFQAVADAIARASVLRADGLMPRVSVSSGRAGRRHASMLPRAAQADVRLVVATLEVGEPEAHVVIVRLGLAPLGPPGAAGRRRRCVVRPPRATTPGFGTDRDAADPFRACRRFGCGLRAGP